MELIIAKIADQIYGEEPKKKKGLQKPEKGFTEKKEKPKIFGMEVVEDDSIPKDEVH